MRATFVEGSEFSRLRRGETPVDLARVALEVARDVYPGLDVEAPLAFIDGLARRVRDRTPALDNPRKLLGQINWVLFAEEGFRGNTEDYHDPKNSYLNDVLHRRVGIPITLSVLYARVARSLGLPIAGVNLPAHFMLRVDTPRGAVFVDPFHEGALLDAQACRKRLSLIVGSPVSLTDAQMEPCCDRTLMVRLLRNLKANYLREHDYASVLPIQRRLVSLLTDDPMEHRDLGMLFLRLDRPAESIAPLQAFVDGHPAAPNLDEMRDLLRAVKIEAAQRN